MYFSANLASTSDIADTDAEYARTTSSKHHFPTQKELNNVILHLGLTKSEQSY